jgi:hypothetical protein
MKLRKNKGTELKQGEYFFPNCKKKYIITAKDREMILFVEAEAERLSPFISHIMELDAENQLLRRRLLRLGIPEEELLWAKDEPKETINGICPIPKLWGE